MSDYPEKACEIDSLITHAKLVAAALEHRKTQQRRNGVYGYPGENFELEGQTFTITDLRRESIADMTEADAQAEGYPNLQMYKDLIERMHPGMNLSDKAKVWVHEFKRCEA